MSTYYTLEFEKPLRELDERIERLRAGDTDGDADPRPPEFGADRAPTPIEAKPATDADAIEEASRERERLLDELYRGLSPWETVAVARHPERPQTRALIELMCKDFAELHGDRGFRDDPAIVAGFARIGAHKCVLIGHQKGVTTEEKLACHFGCAHPEGYRKALRVMKLGAKFKLPIVTLVDTPGAYPGVGAEQRGQAEAIAVNLREMSRLSVPIISVVIGEGGSGGALGLAVADRVAMLAHAWYSVISPEGCAAILWKKATPETNAAAAEALNLTAKANLRLGIIDDIIPEPRGGAHRDHAEMAGTLEKWISDQIRELKRQKPAKLVERRYERFRKLGDYQELPPAPADDVPAADPA